MSYFKRVTLFFFLITGLQSAFAQQDSISINTIIAKTARLTEQPYEKVYLHFDKPYYAVGDTIWFKAYLTTLANVPSPLSKIVYVEVISSKDSLVQTLKLPINEGVSWGNIVLSELNYKQDNYRIRAYTRWMLNFGDDYFFRKVIPVANAIKKPLATHISFSENGKKINVRVQFKDAEGKPYANKRVNWSVQSGFDVVDKARNTTDSQGFLSLAVNSSQKPDVNVDELKLVTELVADNTKTLTSTFSLKTAFQKLDVQFFPEGGDLLAGISSKVAFKAIKSDGLGVAVQGEITDNSGKAVAQFKSQHLGMGVFTFKPESGEKYKANVLLADGSTVSYPLPDVKQSGISLQVNAANATNLHLQIAASQPFYQQYKNKVFYIVGQSGTVIYYAAQTILKEQTISAAIPKDKFPPGILQLTLFNSEGQALSERLAFIQQGDNAIKLAVSTDRQTYTPKQKVQLTITAKKQDSLLNGNFSVAVVDESKVPVDQNTETTILSSLLLTSDLKGFIENPNYYFYNTDDKKLADLDVLMLTQGYRRFSYQDILKDKYPPISVLPEQNIEISGTLRNSTGMPVNKGNMRIRIPDKGFTDYTVTNGDGRFKFSNLVLSDTSEVIIDARTSAKMMIMIDGNYFPAIRKNTVFPQEILNIDSSLEAYIANSKKQYRNFHVLEEVVIKAKPVAGPSHSDYPALSGLSTPDHLISGDRFTGCNNLLMCLQTAATGMIFDKEYFYVTRDYNAGRRIPAQVYLNGMPVDVNALNTVSPAEVASIEIFLKDDLGLVNRATQTNGVLVVNMKEKPKGTPISKQQLMDLLPKSNEVSFAAVGYTKIRQFYSPKYETSQSKMINDLRTTIYWNPLVVTGEDGKATLSYFNADGKGPYRVIVEGIDKEGNLGRAVYHYTVK